MSGQLFIHGRARATAADRIGRCRNWPVRPGFLYFHPGPGRRFPIGVCLRLGDVTYYWGVAP